MRRNEFFSIGPFDGDGAQAFADSLMDYLNREPGALGAFVGEPGVDLVDGRVWYARGMDVETVRPLVRVLRAGLTNKALGLDERQIATSMLDDMETWLSRDYDQSLDQVDDE